MGESTVGSKPRFPRAEGETSFHLIMHKPPQTRRVLFHHFIEQKKKPDLVALAANTYLYMVRTIVFFVCKACMAGDLS